MKTILISIFVLLMSLSVSGKENSVDFQEYLERLGSKSNVIEQLPNGESLYDKRTEMVKRAHRSIYLSNFHMLKHSSTKEFMEILCQKSKDGVDVRMLLDSFASKKPYKKTARKLNEKCGIRTIFYNELRWGLRKAAQALHSKMLVVDGREVIIGGSGFGKKNINASFEDPIWYDLDVYMLGESACYFHRKFVDLYKYSANRQSDPKKLHPHIYTGKWDIFFHRYGGTIYGCTPLPVGNSTVLSIDANPMHSKKRPLLEAYDIAIKSSKKRIWFYAPFFAPLKKFSKMLIAAAKRGVDVRVMTNSAKSTDDIRATTYSSFKASRYLVKNGVRIFTWKKKSTLHRKGAIFDDKWITIGSDNYDRRSQNYSAEVVMFTDDKKEVDIFKEEIERDFQFAKEETVESLSKELKKLGKKAKFFAWLLHRWF